MSSFSRLRRIMLNNVCNIFLRCGNSNFYRYLSRGTLVLCSGTTIVTAVLLSSSTVSRCTTRYCTGTVLCVCTSYSKVPLTAGPSEKPHIVWVRLKVWETKPAREAGNPGTVVQTVVQSGGIRTVPCRMPGTVCYRIRYSPAHTAGTVPEKWLYWVLCQRSELLRSVASYRLW